MSRFGSVSPEMEAKILSLAGDQVSATGSIAAPVGVYVPPESKKQKVDPKDLVAESFEPPATWIVPVATYSSANSRDIKASIGRKGSQQDKVFAVLGKHHQTLALFADFAIHTKGWQVKITLTRLAPGELDEFENLPMSLKAIVDAVARMLGVKDKDKRIKFVAQQEKSKLYGVRIQMEVVG
jgi:hypothetical protein